MMKVTKTIDRIARLLSYISMALIFLVMVWMTADVVGRYAFNKPLIGGLEVSEVMFALLTFTGLGYTAVLKGNISVDILVERFHPRVRAVLDAINQLIATVLFALMAWQNTGAALHDKLSNSTTPSLHIPFFPVKLVVSAGMVVLCLVLLSQFAQSLERILGRGKELHEHKPEAQPSEQGPISDSV